MPTTRRQVAAALLLLGLAFALVGLVAVWFIAPLLGALLTIAGGAGLAGTAWLILGRA